LDVQSAEDLEVIDEEHIEMICSLLQLAPAFEFGMHMYAVKLGVDGDAAGTGTSTSTSTNTEAKEASWTRLQTAASTTDAIRMWLEENSVTGSAANVGAFTPDQVAVASEFLTPGCAGRLSQALTGGN
jgi:hypothetical protein